MGHVETPGPSTEREIPAGPQPETERSGKFSTSTGYYLSISVRTLVSTFSPVHTSLCTARRGAMILPSRHGRGVNGRRIGGHSGPVAIVRSAAAASSCVRSDGQARVCAMDLRALEEWGKGKGEKGGGRGSCERRTNYCLTEQQLHSHAAGTEDYFTAMIMSANHHHHEVSQNDKYRALWTRNQGVARMLLAQLISSFMAVAAKLLQTPQVIIQPLESRQVRTLLKKIRPCRPLLVAVMRFSDNPV